jgi:hypothetical protein
MSIKKFQMKDLLEHVATNEAKKADKKEDKKEEEMEEDTTLELDVEEEVTETESEEVVEEEVVEEETTAASSLKAGSRSGGSDPKSKVGYLTAIVGHLAGAKKEDLVKWFNDAQSQFGPGKDYGVGDKSGSNQASIDMKGGKGPKTKDPMPKLHVKEDVEEMFAGHNLSEEFKDNIASLFEASVSARTTLEIARLEEEYETAFVESVSEITEELTAKLDSYLDYVTEQWMESNEVAIESTLRNELMEEFIGGLKDLFAEHYIDVPQEKVNVIEALADKVEALESALDESINENVELKKAVNESSKEEILNGLSEGLAFSQVEKFKALAEGIDFDGDLETYGKKLAFVKESYFSTKKTVVSTNIEEETFEGETSIITGSMDPSVSRYVEAINRNVKK